MIRSRTKYYVVIDSDGSTVYGVSRPLPYRDAVKYATSLANFYRRFYPVRFFRRKRAWEVYNMVSPMEDTLLTAIRLHEVSRLRKGERSNG